MSMLYPLAHLALFLLEWILLGLTIRLWLKSNSVAMIILPILLASLSYDNFLLATGNWIGAGELLQLLSRWRFLLHYSTIPMFIVVGVELAHRAGAAWSTTKMRFLSWIIALGLAAIDIATNYVGLQLTSAKFAGVLRYQAAFLHGPPTITIIVNLFILLIGIGLFIRLKWQWLFIGTFVALIGNTIPSSLVGTLPSSVSEFVLAISLLLTEQRTQSSDLALLLNQKLAEKVT